MPEFYLTLFALPLSPLPAERLEVRMKRFLEGIRGTESLDEGELAQMAGSERKADYLLGGRRIVAELKTLNGDPKDRIEQRLRERMAQPGAPLVFGRYGLSPVLNSLPDREHMLRVLNDLSGRAVRRHLQKSDEQIQNSMALVGKQSSAGLSIVMNDSEPMIDAANIGYAIKSAFENVASGYSNISFVWVSIECHRLNIPGAGQGYPQLLVTKSSAPSPELNFMGGLLNGWAQYNGSILHHLEHNGDWDTMLPIYEGGPPVLSLY